MRRRLVLVAAGSLTAAMGLAAACSFPEPALTPDDAAAADGASHVGDDAAAPSDAGLADSVYAIDGNENVDPKGATQDASIRPPDASLVDAAGCADQCDCDEDEVRSNSATCDPVGNDCDDLDPFVPHEGFVASRPDDGRTGDWDCDGKVTKQFAVNVGDCSLLSDCSAQGFKGDPACGAPGEYVYCKKVLGLLCGPDKSKPAESRVQGCR